MRDVRYVLVCHWVLIYVYVARMYAWVMECTGRLGMSLGLGLQKLQMERLTRLNNYNAEEEERELNAIMAEQTELEKEAAAAAAQSSSATSSTSSFHHPFDMDSAVPSKDNGGGGAFNKKPLDRSRAPQKIMEESAEDLEIEVAGASFLVDKESGIVFELVERGEDPPEVGTWDAAARAIVFVSQP
eukprot:COSAG05_NODE_3035_length_2397_cov_2.703655_1_plen_186_part_00